MALETASFPPGLVVTNPVAGDSVAFGGDHIRLIKRVIANTFPKLNGPVTATPAQLDAVKDPSRFAVPGLVFMWGGPASSIPAGWKLCNGVGTTSNGIPVPNLKDKFVVGAGGAYAVGATGGSTTHAHTVATSVAGHALTEAQLPPHVHPGLPKAFSIYKFSADFGSDPPKNTSINYIYTPFTLGSTGGGQPHAHGSSSSNTNAVNHLPPHYVISFIVKN